MPRRLALILLGLFLGGLAACRAVEIPPTPPHVYPLENTPTPLPTQPPAVSSILAAQAEALRAEFQGDLAMLRDQPVYEIALELQPEQAAYRGALTLTYTNTTGASLSELYFRLYPNYRGPAGNPFGDGRLEVTAARADTAPVEMSLSVSDSALRVALPAALPPGGQTQIELDFTGRLPGSDSGGGYGIYYASPDILALAGWYPILARYDHGWDLPPVYPYGDAINSETAFYQVNLNLPADWQVISTGRESPVETKTGGQAVELVSGPSRDVFIIAGRGWQLSTRLAGGVTINSYYVEAQKDGGERALEAAAAALEVFNRRFGPCPYTEMDLVQAPLINALGVEFPGVMLIGSSIYPDWSGPVFSSVVAHEVAHQWWYGLVGNDVITDPWMDEALATYSSGLYFEDTQGAAGYAGSLAAWQERYDDNRLAGLDGPVGAPLSEFFDPQKARAYAPLVYYKGALFFDALRLEIGDEAFFAALQTYFQQQRYRFASRQDLLDSFEAASGRELDIFYVEWGLESVIVSAQSAPTPASMPTPSAPLTVTFAVIGDYGSQEPGSFAVAGLVAGWQPDFIVTTGDNNYPNGEESTIDANIGQHYAAFIGNYRGNYGAGPDQNRFFPALGNHDWYTAGAQPYLDYFTLPGNERYYTATFGVIDLFILNSDPAEPAGVGASSRQAEWLRAALAASAAPWQVVVAHTPPYSSGRHGSTDWMQWPFAAWGADAVLAGHDHSYERLKIGGVTYIVNGLGGYSIYNFGEPLPGSQRRYNAAFGAQWVQAGAATLDMRFYNVSRDLIDQVVLRK